MRNLSTKIFKINFLSYLSNRKISYKNSIFYLRKILRKQKNSIPIFFYYCNCKTYKDSNYLHTFGVNLPFCLIKFIHK